MVNSKHAFWQAFIITVVIFVAGLVLGFYVELSSVNKSDLLIRSAEIDLLDNQIKISSLTNDFNFNCNTAKSNLFNFADEIYKDVSKFEEQEGQSKFTANQGRILHKRYDLLRLQLWMESLEIKKKCNESFHTVVYFFDYGASDVEIKSQQRILSIVLMDLKYAHSDEIFLIPIASNLDLSSIDLIKQTYHISQAPSILIDESVVVTSLVSLERLEEIIFDIEIPKNTLEGSPSNSGDIIILN